MHPPFWLSIFTLLTSWLACADSMPCAELSRELRFPCDCALDPDSDPDHFDGHAIFMNCDRVVFAGELPTLPYAAPIVAFSQRYAGHQALPPQLFGDSALPLRKVDFSGNSLRRLTERLLQALRGSLLELYLADNLLGDTLNPIFSSSEFHGLVHLQILDLSGNMIRAIEEGILKGCVNLQELRLDRNTLFFVPSNSLNGPRALRILSLSKNQIGVIKPQAFAAQRSLEKLDLSENLISVIESGAFEQMDKLRVLKISKNKLTKFNSDVFNGAHNIMHLDLADNFINEFPTVALKAFTTLRKLNLSANAIQSVENTDLEALVNLQQLDLSRNNIANIAPGTFLGLKQLQQLDISVNSLRTIEDDAFEGLNNLVTLSLKDNNILLIPASALGRLPVLGSLRLDYNRIAALSGDILRSMAERVTTLILARNVIRELPPATFEHFRQLEHLDLSGNSLTSLISDTFVGLEHTLRTLKVSQNKITTFVGPPLTLSSLELLDLSGNQLTELSRDAFAFLSSLKYLNISGNPLINFSPSLLHQLPLLETLDLSRSGFRTLLPVLFSKSLHIRHIHLSHNYITELGDGTFVNLSNLSFIDLSNNGMSNIRPQTFVNTMGIRILLFNNNRLTSFKGEMFNTGTGLEIIDLSNNELGYLFPSSFKIHPRLRQINIARNKLNFFPAELITGLQYLEFVDLSGNTLKNVEELEFGRLPRLRTLLLADNQLDTISEMAFHNSTQLQTLDLSKNKIDRLGDRTFEGLVRLDLLNLESNLLTELPDTIFERARLQMLENVNLANNLFEVAPLKALQRQYFFVTSVDLSHNKLKDIPADDSVMVNIKKLDLSFNPLSSESVANVLGEPKTVRKLNLAGTGITEVTRLETPFLRHLNLSYNNISLMPEAIFERTSLLETLDLSHNQLTGNLSNTWPLLKSLQSLNVSYNPITSISQTDLVGLESLRYLSIHDLPECNKIEKNAFKSVPNLSELDAYGYPKLGYLDVQGLLKNLPTLERVNIETKESALGSDQLRSVLHSRLRELGVMGSRLKSVSSGTLSGLKSSDIVIRFRNTSLSSLPPALFFPVPRSSSVVLDLSGSKLTAIPTQTLTALDDRRGDLQLTGLDSNPIVCDCNSRTLHKWLANKDVSVVCFAPQHLAGRSLSELEDSQLTCEVYRPQESVTGRTTYNLPSAASKVTVEPEIIWSVMTPTDRTKPKPPAIASAGNDDTLIIGIVGGVVAFIAILIIIICVIRLRVGNSNEAMNHYPGPLGPMVSPMSGPGSSCACSTKGMPVPTIYGTTGPGYAATLPHKMHVGPPPPIVPRHAYSTVSRISPFYPNTPQPYFVAFPPDEKIYR